MNRAVCGQMERRTRLRKMLADMDDDQKAERFGAHLGNPPATLPKLVHGFSTHQQGSCYVQQDEGNPRWQASKCRSDVWACAAAGTDLEYEEEPPPQNEIFYTEAPPALKAARMEVRKSCGAVLRFGQPTDLCTRAPILFMSYSVRK